MTFLKDWRKICSTKLNILQATFFFISKAWDLVSRRTIAKALEKSYFWTDSIKKWICTLPVINIAIEESWEHFSNVDDEELEMVEDMTEDEILSSSKLWNQNKFYSKAQSGVTTERWSRNELSLFNHQLPRIYAQKFLK